MNHSINLPLNGAYYANVPSHIYKQFWEIVAKKIPGKPLCLDTLSLNIFTHIYNDLYNKLFQILAQQDIDTMTAHKATTYIISKGRNNYEIATSNCDDIINKVGEFIECDILTDSG
jgi:hypothetical protein